jgi:hypothetical protein
MSWKAPKQTDVPREGPSLPPAGRYDVHLSKVEPRTSGGGQPQMVWTYAIDTGPHAGYQIKEWHTFTPGNDLVWQRLANICDGAGFTWIEEAPSFDAFASQFPTDGTFRFSIECEQRYSVKGYTDTVKAWQATKYSPVSTRECSHANTITLSKEDWDAWDADDKDKFANLGPREGFDFHRIYGPPQSVAELAKRPAAPAVAGANGEWFESDDDLPF